MACSNLASDCSFLSCAWKAPRVLSGCLASTTQPQGPSEDEIWWKGRLRSSNSSIPTSPYLSYRFQNITCMDCKCQAFKRRKSRINRCCGCNSTGKPQNGSATVSIASLWKELEPVISYLPPTQLGMIKNALQLAFEAHEGQKRRSGEPYIIHPVEVATILAELELDWETIAAGLLHDTVEDTNVVTFGMIEQQFGPVVRRIVEGETKVSKLGKLQCASSEAVSCDVKADDLRQMFLAMTEEVRVIIVKLADRLHNMRTLMYMPPPKQRHIALETLQVFAPLARLLGMYKIKSELEDLSFMYSHPEQYIELKRRVNEIYIEHQEEALEAKRYLLQQIADDQFLDFMAVDVKVHVLCKELYSIYKKLSESDGLISTVQDIDQLRVILNPKPQTRISQMCNPYQICYHVLGFIHQTWTPVPQSVKDYIATPKPNGYQSLHTKVLPFLYENTFRLEVQIRTEEMDILAERGIAAHYSGKAAARMFLGEPGFSKGSSNFLSNVNLARRVSWLNAIREWQEEFVGNMTAREFVDTVTGDLLGSRVFVFTPKGEIKNLPKGATVIDYAYQIHTELGNKMVAAKVNGNLVSPAHTLANAEVVEVITYDGLSTKSLFQRHRQWLQHAKTRSARHKIMKFLQEQALLSADEITADAIKNFIFSFGNSENEIQENLTMLNSEFDSMWLDFPQDIHQKHMPALISPFKQQEVPSNRKNAEKLPHVLPYLNGRHNKQAEKTAIQLDGDPEVFVNMMSKFLVKPAALNLLPIPDEVMACLELWQAARIASWHSRQEQSIQWFSASCIDRKSMLAEITAVLCAANILICACVAETDQIRGLGIMLFHVEGSKEKLMDACARVDSIPGVLYRSVGCSWQKPGYSAAQYLKC